MTHTKLIDRIVDNFLDRYAAAGAVHAKRYLDRVVGDDEELKEEVRSRVKGRVQTRLPS